MNRFALLRQIQSLRILHCLSQVTPSRLLAPGSALTSLTRLPMIRFLQPLLTRRFLGAFHPLSPASSHRVP